MSHFQKKLSQKRTRRCSENTALTFKRGRKTVKQNFNTNHLIQTENCVLTVDIWVPQQRVCQFAALCRARTPQSSNRLQPARPLTLTFFLPQHDVKDGTDGHSAQPERSGEVRWGQERQRPGEKDSDYNSPNHHAHEVIFSFSPFFPLSKEKLCSCESELKTVTPPQKKIYICTPSSSLWCSSAPAYQRSHFLPIKQGRLKK